MKRFRKVCHKYLIRDIFQLEEKGTCFFSSSDALVSFLLVHLVFPYTLFHIPGLSIVLLHNAEKQN